MGENSGLCGILETIKNNFHIRSLDLSLHSTQGTKDTVIEEYLSRLDERLLNIDISSKRFNNLTKEVHNAIYDLGDDPTITIKWCLSWFYRGCLGVERIIGKRRLSN